ncbi:MAG: hypothetical protein AB7S93_07935 [Xanthobacteraceae bacterium]
MIIHSVLNFRALDQRLRRLESNLARGSFPIRATSSKKGPISDEKLNELIAQLPPDCRFNANRLIEQSYQQLRAAETNFIELGIETQNSEAIRDAIWTLERKQSLGRYLERGRRFQAATNAQLKEWWVVFFRAFFFNHMYHDYADQVEAELELRGESAPVESVKQELKTGTRLALRDPDVKKRIRDMHYGLMDKIDEQNMREAGAEDSADEHEPGSE